MRRRGDGLLQLVGLYQPLAPWGEGQPRPSRGRAINSRSAEGSTVTRGPILFYCQHLLGLGHLERAARLTRALRRAGEPVVFVQGGRPVPGSTWAMPRSWLLPAPRGGERGGERPGAPGRPSPGGPRDLADRRDHLPGGLRDAWTPSVILLELFPFGRHALTSELRPSCSWRRPTTAPGDAAPRVVVSLRDVLVSKPNQAWSELAAVAVARQWTDRVLVHGSPDLIPLTRTVALADSPRGPARFTPDIGSGRAIGQSRGARGGRDLGRRRASRRGRFFLRRPRRVAPHGAGAHAQPWRLVAGP